jgi:DNA repair exonuclease SbcCD ATPase subunit
MSKWVEAIKEANKEFENITEDEIRDRIKGRMKQSELQLHEMYQNLVSIKNLNDEYKKLPRSVRRQKTLKEGNAKLLKQADTLIAEIRTLEKAMRDAYSSLESINDTTGS